MQSLNIPVEVVASGQHRMAEALLVELLDALRNLLAQNQPQTIDVHGLPIEQAGRRHLQTLLGKGEIKVTLDTLGRSDIHETAYSGIWWVSHYDAGEQLISEFIEVNWIPEIVKSQRVDVARSLAALEHRINPDE